MQIMGFLVELFALFCVLTLPLGFASHAVGHGVYGKVSRELLLSLRTSAVGTVPSGIPMELCRPSKSSGHRKRGRRGGLRLRLKTLQLDNCRKLPPLPSVLLSNVQSIRNKLDELETYAKFKREVKDTCLLAFTEIWLGDANPDPDLNLTGFGSPIRMDRSSEITGKNRGGGVCFYVNERLYDCGVTDEGCAALTSALRSNPSHLRKLSLSVNKIRDLGVKCLCAVLEDPHCKLEKLKLRYCGVTDEGCAALTSALRSNPSHLRHLDLFGNKLGKSGVKLLSDLKDDPRFKLETLYY